MTGNEDSVGDAPQTHVSGTVENKADAFGLVEKIVHVIGSKHQTFTPTTYRVDVSIEFTEVDDDD